MITVVNVRFDHDPQIVYIGRRMPGRPGSPLGNPFKIGAVADPIDQYRRWLWNQMQSDTSAMREVDRLARLHRSSVDIKLGCWCAPQPCHGDVVKRAIEWLASALDVAAKG